MGFRILHPTLKSVIRGAVPVLCVVAVLWVGACTGLYHAMRGSTEHFGHVMAKIPGPIPFLVLPFETLWLHARSGTLQIGDPAPDFSLTKLDKTGAVQLSAFAAQGKPVVLIFGSYT